MIAATLVCYGRSMAEKSVRWGVRRRGVVVYFVAVGPENFDVCVCARVLRTIVRGAKTGLSARATYG